MSKLSVLVPCHNSEKTIRRTLESVRWADEIVVVDSFSTDGTLDICRGYADRLLQHEFTGFAAQKNWGLERCSHDWVLQVDSDERLEPGLQEEIQSALVRPDPEVNCYRIPRKNYTYGRWVRGCGFYPDYQTRLFRRSKASFSDRAVHERIEASGPMPALRHHLLHEDFKGIGPHLAKLGRYSLYELEELRRRGHRLRWWDLWLRPPAVFLRAYFLRAGWRDGYPGLLQAGFLSLGVFLKYARLWESEWERKGGG